MASKGKTNIISEIISVILALITFIGGISAVMALTNMEQSATERIYPNVIQSQVGMKAIQTDKSQNNL